MLAENFFNSSDSYTGCRSTISNQCVCSTWLVTSMMVILLNFVHLAFQILFALLYGDFDPQGLLFCFTNNTKLFYTNVFWKFCSPRNCLFSFLEVVTITVSWMHIMVIPSASYECINSGGWNGASVKNRASMNAVGTAVGFSLLITASELLKPCLYLIKNFQVSSKRNANAEDYLPFVGDAIDMMFQSCIVALNFSLIQIVQCLSFCFGLSTLGLGFYLSPTNHDDLCLLLPENKKTNARDLSMVGFHLAKVAPIDNNEQLPAL